MKKILITGAGGPLGVNVTRSLKRAPEILNLIGTEANRYHLPLSLTDKTLFVPHAEKEKEYLKSLKDIVKSHGIDLIFPTHPLELKVLGAHRDEFKAKLFLPRQKVIETGNNKFESYEIWKEKEVPVPLTMLVSSKDGLKKAFKAIGTRPVWVRGSGTPGQGVGGKALACQDEEAAWFWITHWDGLGKFICSEYLPGDNMTWLSIWKNGKLVTSQGRQRLEYVLPHVSQSGITGAPAVSKTVHCDELNKTGEKAVTAIDDDPNGVYFVDLKADKKGSLKMTEINAGRFGTTIHFYTEAGVNFPYIFVKLAFGETVDIPKYDPLEKDLYWIRTLDCGPVLLRGEEIEA